MNSRRLVGVRYRLWVIHSVREKFRVRQVLIHTLLGAAKGRQEKKGYE